MSKRSATIAQEKSERLVADCPLLAKAIPGLLRHEKSTFAAYFQPVCVSSQVGQTATKLCCHYLLRDGNGKVRVKDLAERLQHEVINYAIPRSRIQEAKQDFEQTNSTAQFVKLEREARGLFCDLKNTGEGGELLLYVLTESILGLPQLTCSPKLDPVLMRVFTARMGKEILDEAEETWPGPSHRQAA